MKSAPSKHPWPKLLFFVLLVALASCRPQPKLDLPPPQPPPLPPAAPKARIDNETTLAWARTEPYIIVVDKRCRALRLYQYGHLVRSYPAVFGRNRGRKLYEGDQRTPIGLYMITAKYPHQRWSRFMLLDYPTEQDVRRYWHHVRAGDVPRRGDSYRGVGGAIGIHGTDDDAMNRVGVNWTLGCVSLLNEDIDDLYAFVSVGTLVYIKD